MKKPPEDNLGQQALKAMQEAVAQVVEDHRQRGEPLAILRDGKAVWVYAEELGALREAPTPYRSKSQGA
jgi:PHD/YefM family antitoxin component YafN of YafNO toxin-antitoxin module